MNTDSITAYLRRHGHKWTMGTGPRVSIYVRGAGTISQHADSRCAGEHLVWLYTAPDLTPYLLSTPYDLDPLLPPTHQDPLQELKADLADALGGDEAAAAEVIGVLRQRDDDENADAWRKELETAYWSRGRNRTDAQLEDALQMYMQWRRIDAAMPLLKYNGELSRKAWARLHGPPLLELLAKANLPHSRQRSAASAMRARIAHKLCVPSTTNVPPSILDEAVTSEMTRLHVLHSNGGMDRPGKLAAALMERPESAPQPGPEAKPEPKPKTTTRAPSRSRLMDEPQEHHFNTVCRHLSRAGCEREQVQEAWSKLFRDRKVIPDHDVELLRKELGISPVPKRSVVVAPVAAGRAGEWARRQREDRIAYSGGCSPCVGVA